MRDGSKYAGDFEGGEITGKGVKKFSNGKLYQGDFLEGEMHGAGLLQYNTEAKGEQDRTYDGEFHLNSREGQGVLTKASGDVISGTFRGNQPTGEAQVHFGSGDVYTGELIKGVMTGQGLLECTNSKTYEGQFEEGKLHGEGKFSIHGGTYCLSGAYCEGVPEMIANKYLVKVESPVEEKEEPVAGKGGKAAPAKAPAAIPETTTESLNAVKISIDVKNPDETKRLLALSIMVVF